MPREDIEFRPVDHITTDAIGQPGKRVFYIYAWQGQRTVTLILEKLQILSLAEGVEQFLSEVREKYPDLDEPSADYTEEKMRIQPPVDPLFRIGDLGLGYDANADLVVLVAREMTAEEAEGDQEAEPASVVRLWCTRSQIRALARWGVEVASRGRPLCPQCGQPIEPEGHFCPKKNGHKH
jgi:uncharacterized repeat protein (TIGR03847 family)